jgi:chromosomal replication initiation ATPase DnaA
MVRASNIWRIVSVQIQCLLGKEVHQQWFNGIIPIVLSNRNLILRAPNKQTCLWVTRHYHQLIDLLLSFQDEHLTCFILEPSDTSRDELVKVTTSVIESEQEKAHC